jgi:hypothetical protein
VQATEISRVLCDRAFDKLFQWMIFAGLVCVGAVVLWDYGFLSYIFIADTSGISALIVALFLALSVFCVYVLFALSPELRALETAAVELEAGGSVSLADGELRMGGHTMPQDYFVTAHLRDIVIKQQRDPEGSREILAQALSARLRSQARIGIFMSDVLYKLGMLGTVVGFILMLSSMGNMGNFDVETLRGALQAMTGGMAVSLLTTIAGLTQAAFPQTGNNHRGQRDGGDDTDRRHHDPHNPARPWQSLEIAAEPTVPAKKIDRPI